ncbi:MAG: Rieske 2Fe-2S domain-containing protein [Deltaproteobacteria bacterium]|nr:Rieske 2Fe-2S domain-containing protein [Deltaproteobacteria bacterium]
MTTEDFRDIEHTGPGTPAGRYMRAYWQPIYRAEDLHPGRAVPLRVMSEDFTLYRGEGGNPHLTVARCAHRGTQLSTGWVEEDCIRCRYHGWKFDGSGQCVEQPGEEGRSAENVKIRTYPVEEYLGLLFAYLGEGAPPAFRRYPQFENPGLLFTLPPECWPCNYFNRLDNDPDAYHVVYTHTESIRRANRQRRYTKRETTAELTPYGLRTVVRLPDSEIEYLHQYMPNVNQIRVRTGMASAPGQQVLSVWEDRMTWAVPQDDENSYRFEVNLVDVTGEAAKALEQTRRRQTEGVGERLNRLGDQILAGELSIEDLGPELSTYEIFRIEDYVTQVGQGRIADRSAERIAKLDMGVVLRRKLWQREMKALADGNPLTEWLIPAERDDSPPVEQHGA